MAFNYKQKSTGGRPPKHPDEKRSNHSVKISCAKKEKDYIVENAARYKLSQSEFCLRLVLEGKLPALFLDDVTELSRQVRAVGVNLNQISKSLNELNKGGLMSILKRKSLETKLDENLEGLADIIRHIMDIRKMND